jgi:hypothetical protein
MNNKITDALSNFSSSAMCRWMQSETIAQAVPWIVAAGARQPTPQGKAAALGLFALQQGCSLNNTGEPLPPGNGCVETTLPTYIQFKGSIGWEGPMTSQDPDVSNTDLTKIEGLEFDVPVPDSPGRYYATVTSLSASQGSQTWVSNNTFSRGGASYRLFLQDGNKCEKEAPDQPADPTEPITDYSPELNCELTADLGGFLVNPSGNVSPIIKYSAGEPNLRADGGIISGCNWYGDIVQVSPDGGCGCPPTGPLPPDIPWPIPEDGIPEWLRDLVTGIAADLIADQIDDALEQDLPPAVYKLIAPCDVDSEGNPLEVEVQIPPQKANAAIAARIEALVPLLQGQKDFKQPICPPVKPEGEFRTIGFISEKTSPNGKSALRKRLRYRSVSGLGLNALIDYWKDFRFEAGPVTVKHRGSSWGTITVWAASADEGKRVIRHAAGEAGVDADQTGRWEISGSSSSRLGMPGSMKVNQSGGYYWITARDGSDNRPLVGTT